MSEAPDTYWLEHRGESLKAVYHDKELAPDKAIPYHRERECRWILDNDPDFTVWHSNCGGAHVFMDGGPGENEHKFCPYCAGKIKVEKDDE